MRSVAIAVGVIGVAAAWFPRQVLPPVEATTGYGQVVTLVRQELPPGGSIGLVEPGTVAFHLPPTTRVEDLIGVTTPNAPFYSSASLDALFEDPPDILGLRFWTRAGQLRVAPGGQERALVADNRFHNMYHLETVGPTVMAVGPDRLNVWLFWRNRART